MAKKYEEKFAALFGRAVNETELRAIQRIQDILGIREDDALWGLLLALQFHTSLYEEIPGRIETAAKASRDSLIDSAKAAIGTLSAETKNEIAKAIGVASTQVAQEVAQGQRELNRRKLVQWLAIAGVVLAVAMSGFGYAMHNAGRSVGREEGRQRDYQEGFANGRKVGEAAGYQAAKDEKAAASWASTTEGRQARELAKLGALGPALNLAKAAGGASDLQMLAACSKPGWQIKEGGCLPYVANDGRVYGWRIATPPPKTAP